ncbi:hypothetical protein [Chitinimonas sp.]|uniref:hypothetical protein n=1 Tax=Chitinimonas sp. TaxID=1934313 RepID=UPI0035AEF279
MSFSPRFAQSPAQRGRFVAHRGVASIAAIESALQRKGSGTPTAIGAKRTLANTMQQGAQCQKCGEI